VVRNALLPGQRPLTFALAFLPWQVAFFAAPFLLAGLVALVLGRWLRRPALPHLLLRGLAGAVTLQELQMKRLQLLEAYERQRLAVGEMIQSISMFCRL